MKHSSEPLIVCRAITERRRIEFKYGSGMRSVIPLAHGLTRGGHEALFGFQLTGPSDSKRSTTGWKTFRLDGISDLAIAADNFDPAEFRYERDPPQVAVVHCQA